MGAGLTAEAEAELRYPQIATTLRLWHREMQDQRGVMPDAWLHILAKPERQFHFEGVSWPRFIGAVRPQDILGRLHAWVANARPASAHVEKGHAGAEKSYPRANVKSKSALARSLDTESSWKH